MSLIRINYLLFFFVVSCLIGLPITGQTHGTVKQQIEALNQRLEENLLQSNQHLENSEFYQAEVLTNQVLADLDLLLEATMPLDERINQLIEREELIIKQTKKIQVDKSKGTDQSASDSNLNELIFSQVKNREKTNSAATITKKQLETFHKQAEQGSSQQEKNQTVQKNLQDVKALLETASNSQTAAINDLEEERFKSAAGEEIAALDYLKKALEKLRQNTKSQSQAQNKQQSGQQKKDQKQASNQQQQSQNQAKENSTSKESTEALKQKKKMEAEEALKQLAKLRKKAREEQERRRKQFGVQDSGGQYPVEKDW